MAGRQMSDVKETQDEQEAPESTAADNGSDMGGAAADAPAEAPTEDSPGEAAIEAEAEIELPEGVNLLSALIEAQKEVAANKDGWQRARAEFANYKKRVDRERSEIFQRASLDTLKALLPIIDDFDRAFENLPEDISEHAWIGGVSMIQRKFATILEAYAIEAIDPTGQAFDPMLHQAIGTEESDDIESGNVTATLQKGYRAGDAVLRLALVKVAS